jgi:DNA topoisomerase III
MKLFLCEKPSQGKDIAAHVGAKVRGNGCITGEGVAVTWCIGHLLEQAKPETYVPELARWSLDKLPVLPEHWKMEVKDSMRGQFAVVRDLLKKTTELVIATDADREGEVIAREVLQLVGYRGAVSRLWLEALDDASIKQGLKRLQADAKTRNLYFSGLGRARADWLMGMNFTMALTTAFGSGGRGGVLHCGRVQTPVLGLIVRRERTIENFKPIRHYGLDARFEIMGSVVPMDWLPGQGVLNAQGHCLDGGMVKAVVVKIERQVGRVTHVKSTPEKELAPLPYYLGSLQKEASKRFGMKVQTVLDACQALYEKHKATTYPRTDCEYLPLSMHAEVPAVLQALGQVDPSLGSLLALAPVKQAGRCFNDAKLTAHHAIIPTANSNVRLGEMSKNEMLVYELIRRRYIAQFLGDHLFTKTVLGVECVGESFTKTGKVTTAPGWRRSDFVGQMAKNKDDEDDKAVVVLPACSVGTQALNISASCVTKNTEAPKRYTEGTLVAAMESIDKEIDDPRFKLVMQSKEKAGIGTEATRPAVIEGLFKREYIANDKKWLIPTERGNQLIGLMESIAPSLVDPVLTAHWEELLSQVESGTLELVQFEQQIKQWLSQLLSEVKAKAGSVRIEATAAASKTTSLRPKAALAGPQCPGCGKGQLRQIKGSKGPFWGCSEYRDGCKTTCSDQDGKPVLEKVGQGASAQQAIKRLESPPVDHGATIKTAVKVAAMVAGQCCPTCQTGQLQLRNLKDSDRQFWGCSGFPVCRQFAWAR